MLSSRTSEFIKALFFDLPCTTRHLLSSVAQSDGYRLSIRHHNAVHIITLDRGEFPPSYHWNLSPYLRGSHLFFVSASTNLIPSVSTCSSSIARRSHRANSDSAHDCIMHHVQHLMTHPYFYSTPHGGTRTCCEAAYHPFCWTLGRSQWYPVREHDQKLVQSASPVHRPQGPALGDAFHSQIKRLE